MNKFGNALLDYHLDPNTIAKLHKKYQHDKKDHVPEKFSKFGSSVDHILDKTKMYRNVKKLAPEETIAERVKIVSLKSIPTIS